MQQAPQPPPPLPEYEQPECPAPNDLWSPGYWSWGSAGYYWVPGVWVAAPYVGALWTPGYWGFARNVYGWHSGYWGPHIGYYGGVRYGFGYVGIGFLGGFWSHDRFNYNRAVTRVDPVRITNVYNRTVIVNNITIINNVSYNGGPGGNRYRPSPAEIAASRERHVPPQPEQLQVVRAAAANRAQFASVNRGRPQLVAISKPVVIRTITPPPDAVNPGVRGAGRIETRPGAPAPRAETPAVPRAEAPANSSNRGEQPREVPANRPAQPANRPNEPAPRTATPTQPRTEAPANSSNRGEQPREVPANRPAQPANRPNEPAPRTATPAQPRPEAPANRPAQPATRPNEPAPRTATPAQPRPETPVKPSNTAEPRREPPANRPTQPAPSKPETPPKAETRKTPPPKPAPEEKKREPEPRSEEGKPQ